VVRNSLSISARTVVARNNGDCIIWW